MKEKNVIRIFYSFEDKGWIAETNIGNFFCPNIISAFGKTPEQALAEIRVAYEACMEVRRANDV